MGCSEAVTGDRRTPSAYRFGAGGERRATAAIRNLIGGDTMMRRSRQPAILADAACRIFQKPKTFTGNFLIDDSFLASEGVTDFDQYRVDPAQPLQMDFFVPDSNPPPASVSLDAKSR